MGRVLRPRIGAPREEWEAYWAAGMARAIERQQKKQEAAAAKLVIAEKRLAARRGITVEQLREDRKIVDEIERARLEKENPSL